MIGFDFCHFCTCWCVCGRQLEALWVLYEPSSGMTDLLGHAVWFWLFLHMLGCGRQLGALWALSEPDSGITDLLGHAVGQT
jgi:hypothetical protein